jgi:hypothetical protein
MKKVITTICVAIKITLMEQKLRIVLEKPQKVTVEVSSMQFALRLIIKSN